MNEAHHGRPEQAPSGMSNVALRAAGLTKRYGSVRALDGLDLEVGVGEVHAFLGPNGAGKTTTIRILLGLLRKDGGEVSLLGADPWRDAVDLHRRLARVPGDVTLWPSLTGREIIDLLGRLRGGINASRLKALTERSAMTGFASTRAAQQARLPPRWRRAARLRLWHRSAAGHHRPRSQGAVPDRRQPARGGHKSQREPGTAIPPGPAERHLGRRLPGRAVERVGDEEAGRLELVGSAAVGRQAPLTAALLAAATANMAIALLTCLWLLVLKLPPAGPRHRDRRARRRLRTARSRRYQSCEGVVAVLGFAARVGRTHPRVRFSRRALVGAHPAAGGIRRLGGGGVPARRLA